MEALTTGGILLLTMILALGSGIWIFMGLMVVSFVGLSFILGLPLDQVGAIMVKRFYGGAGSWELACVPLFMWMGEIIFRTDISDRLFSGLAPLVNKFPGRLLHTNVAACALFAAVSGSSAATTATVGKITITELENRNYNMNLSIGSLAGAGSFGLMIPPSIVFIIYGVLAEESIAQLFLAGVFPGLLLAGLYSAYIMIRSIINPSLAPKIETKYTVSDYLKCIKQLLPVASIICIVFGAIYSGIATPTEAAAVGVFASLFITIILKQFSFKLFVESIMEALKNSCMVCTLVAGAGFLSTAMGLLHIPQEISSAITKFDLSPYQLILVLGIFYMILGFFLESISITVMTLAICLPLVVAAGFSPIWFGVFLVVMMEMAQITPPVGFNLFVIQGMSGHPIEKVAIAAAPFFLLMLLGAIIITVFPQIALMLPSILG
jgi:tripartite ATP-independent transporter DctM subunit